MKCNVKGTSLVVGRNSFKSAPSQPLHGTARGTSLRVGRSLFKSAPIHSFHGAARGTSLVVARSYSKSAPGFVFSFEPRHLSSIHFTSIVVASSTRNTFLALYHCSPPPHSAFLGPLLKAYKT